MDLSSLGVDIVTGPGDMFNDRTRSVLDIDLDRIDARVREVRQHEVDDPVTSQDRCRRDRTEILDALDIDIRRFEIQ